MSWSLYSQVILHFFEKLTICFRSGFDIAQFKAFHRLKVSAVSWFRVSYDLHEAFRRIKYFKEVNSSMIDPGFHAKSAWHTQSRQRTKNSKLRFVLMIKLLIISKENFQKNRVCQSTRVIETEKS